MVTEARGLMDLQKAERPEAVARSRTLLTHLECSGRIDYGAAHGDPQPEARTAQIGRIAQVAWCSRVPFYHLREFGSPP
jgi:hypothetical protein